MHKPTQIHIGLLIIIQWISIAVIILNGLALRISRSTIQGPIRYDPQDFLLLVLGAASLLGSSVLLCLHLHFYFKSTKDQIILASLKTVLLVDMVVGIALSVLWALATSVVMTQFHVSSECSLSQSVFPESYTQACTLLGDTILLGFVVIACWVLNLLLSLLSLSQQPLEETTVITMEDPYQGKYQMSSSIIDEGFHSELYDNKPTLSPPPAAIVKKKDNGRGSLDTYDSRVSWRSDGFEPISLDLLPTIQIGISKLDVCFNETK